MIDRIAAAVLSLILLPCCATGLPQPQPQTSVSREIELSIGPAVAEGWLSTRGEWALFGMEDQRNYNPFVENEALKCVSLINETGLARSALNKLNGRRVIVRGTALKYDELSGGDERDELLGMKTYKNEIVHNFCLRDLVLVVNSIELRAQR